MSADSLLGSVMEFIHTVEEMNRAVLVPTRLLDESSDIITTATNSWNEEAREKGLLEVFELLLDAKEKIIVGREKSVKYCHDFSLRVDQLRLTIKEMTEAAKELTHHYCEICQDSSSSRRPGDTSRHAVS